MKRIKTLLAICAISIFSITAVNAQDIAAATELYNNGAKMLGEKNYTAAIESFSKAMKMAEGLGEEGATIVKDSKGIIPKIYLAFGQDLASQKKVDESIAQLKLAIEASKAAGLADVEKSATELIPQVLMVGANDLFAAEKYAEAIAAYKKVAEVDANNAKIYFYTGVSESRLGNEAGAIAAFEKAISLGDKEDSPKQISNIYLKKAANAIKTKNYADVYASAKKSNEYVASSQAAKLLGIGAFNLKKYDEAIAAIDSYISLEPAAKDKNGMFYYLAQAYEAKKNPAKACGYYKQLMADPTYKQIAEYKVKTELKCK